MKARLCGALAFVAVAACRHEADVPAAAPTQKAAAPRWAEPFDYAHFRRGWDQAGRAWLRAHAGVNWTGEAWVEDVDVFPSVDAQSLYYAGFAGEIGVHAAAVCGDTKLAAELAALYVWFEAHTTTLGEMRRRAAEQEGMDSTLLRGRGPDTTRTFEWIEATSVGPRMRECALCNAQFLFPAAALSRHLAQRDPESWSDVETRFAERVWPMLIGDHLLRLLYVVDWDHWGQADLGGALVPMWERVLAGSAKAERGYHTALLDRDLWLAASAGEVVAAHDANPLQFPLSLMARKRLVRARELGAQRLEAASVQVADSRDFEGRPTKATLYFSGQLADHPDYAHAGARSTQPPEDPAPVQDGTWDIGHAARLPVVLRSLHETRLDPSGFPTRVDLERAGNQFAFSVFNGNVELPGFRNFLDGSDGWFRVNQNGTAVAPSTVCDAALPQRQCLAAGGVRGWPVLAKNQPALQRVFQALLDLSTTDDSARVVHRRRVLQYGREEFRSPASAADTYPIVLLWILGAGAELLTDCGTSVRVR